MSFTLHPGAERDLGEAARFYRREAGCGVAERFLDEFDASRLLLMRIPALESLPGATVVGFRFTVSPIRSSIVSWIRISASWSFGISTATQSTVENVGEAPLRRVAI